MGHERLSPLPPGGGRCPAAGVRTCGVRGCVGQLKGAGLTFPATALNFSRWQICQRGRGLGWGELAAFLMLIITWSCPLKVRHGAQAVRNQPLTCAYWYHLSNSASYV